MRMSLGLIMRFTCANLRVFLSFPCWQPAHGADVSSVADSLRGPRACRAHHECLRACRCYSLLVGSSGRLAALLVASACLFTVARTNQSAFLILDMILVLWSV